MKKLLYLLLAASIGACQPTPTVQKSKVAATQPASISDWPTASDTLKPPPPLPVWHGNVARRNVVSTPITEQTEIEHFFHRYKLVSILQTITGSKEDYALNGFRGDDKYRTEVVVLQARQDPQNPAAYFLAGLSRTKRQVTPFEGQVTFETLSHEPLLTKADHQNIQDFSMFVPVRIPGNEPVTCYAAGGKVTLWEKNKQTNNQVFTGTLIVEVALTKAGKIVLNSPFLHGPSQGGGLKYEGTWVASQGGPAQPAVWVDDIFGYSPNVFKDLAIGEREVDFNPKYAKLGWNSYWENDEWWAKAPKLSLSL